MKKLSLLLIIFLVFSCKTEPKKRIQKKKKQTTKVANSKKEKIGKNTYDEAIERTKNFAFNLDFNLDYIRKVGLPDKKYLAEYLGLFLKLKKAAKTPQEHQKIKDKIEPLYQKTLQSSYHNMAKVDAKLFKKNSMSYMRIMWLLNELDFDISFHKKELTKVQKRMDDHLKLRGEWQKAVFGKYYDYFKIKKPILIKYAHKLKGPISYKKPLTFYNRTNAYILTHFLFAAYDYGNKKTQKRFTAGDIKYLEEILPKIIAKFEAKKNDDLVGELLTCLVLIGKIETLSFKKSYSKLLDNQNKDGSFGSYEKLRRKYKKDVEFRNYLHTTLVDIEMFIEHDFRK